MHTLTCVHLVWETPLLRQCHCLCCILFLMLHVALLGQCGVQAWRRAARCAARHGKSSYAPSAWRLSATLPGSWTRGSSQTATASSNGLRLVCTPERRVQAPLDTCCSCLVAHMSFRCWPHPPPSVRAGGTRRPPRRRTHVPQDRRSAARPGAAARCARAAAAHPRLGRPAWPGSAGRAGGRGRARCKGRGAR